MRRSDLNGWAGYEPVSSNEEAVVTTEALAFDGESVGITADVRDGGSARVSILDEMGEQGAVSEPVDNTVTDFPVDMGGKREFGAVAGREGSVEISVARCETVCLSDYMKTTLGLDPAKLTSVGATFLVANSEIAPTTSENRISVDRDPKR